MQRPYVVPGTSFEAKTFAALGKSEKESLASRTPLLFCCSGAFVAARFGALKFPKTVLKTGSSFASI